MFLIVLLSLAGSAFADVDPLCAGVPPDEIFLFPNPLDCATFFECKNGEKILRDCPAGEWFNSALQACDHPDHSGCVPLFTTTPLPGGDHLNCTVGIVDFYPYPSDCTRYIECYHGELEVHKCPNDLWYNSREKRCVSPEQSGCGTTTPIPTTTTTSRTTTTTPIPTTTTTTPIPTTTTTPIPTTTTTAKPTTTTAKPTTTTTPAPTTTTTTPKPTTTTTTRPTTTTKPITTTTTRTTTRTTTTRPPTTTTTRPTTTKTSGLTCPWPPNDDQYLFADPADCTKYLECAEGELLERDCPPNQYFNAELLVCDWIADSGCIPPRKKKYFFNLF